MSGTATSPSRARLLGAIAIGGFAAFRVGPDALTGGHLTQDGIEHLAIAWSWLHGAGFVDPIQYQYFLEGGPPIPAMAMRSPVVPVLLALPLGVGATLDTVILLHAGLSVVAAMLGFAVATRWMAPHAAALAVAVFVASPAWLYLAVTPLTEIAGVVAFAGVFALARHVGRSPGAAAVCAAATVLASLTRLPLGALTLAVAVAAIVGEGKLGWHALRGVGLYVGIVVVATAGIDLAVTAATGVGLYEGYGLASEMLGNRDLWVYEREYIGRFAFMRENAPEILARVGANAVMLVRVLCLESQYAFVGWAAVPAVLFGLRRDARVEARIASFCVLGYGALAIFHYGAFDKLRYPFFIALPLCWNAAAWLDAVLAKASWRPARWIPLGVLGAALAVPALAIAGRWPEAVRSHAQAQQLPGPREDGGDLARLCVHFDRDALVVSADPWGVHLWCGNRALRIPVAPGDPALLRRYVAEIDPGYFVLARARFEDTGAWIRALEASPEFAALAVEGGYLVYGRVGGTSAAVDWAAPPPLVCAGRATDCAVPAPRAP